MREEEAIDLLARSGCSKDVIEHCRLVALYARKIALAIIECARKRGTQVNIDMDAVFSGGLLHDIGRSRTHGIGHAVEGSRIALEGGLDDKLVNIIERHIGAGIPREEATVLGLPPKDYMPVTLEEKIVAHADNLIIGGRVGTVDELIVGLRKKGLDEKVIRRFIELNDEISGLIC